MNAYIIHKIILYLNKPKLVKIFFEIKDYRSLINSSYADYSLLYAQYGRKFWSKTIDLRAAKFLSNADIKSIKLKNKQKKDLFPIDILAYYGFLDIIIWLCDNYKDSYFSIFSHYAIDYAAINGYLSIIKWLYQIKLQQYNQNEFKLQQDHRKHFFYDDFFTYKAIDYAAENGHFDIIIWFHETFKIIFCSLYAINYASLNGHFDIVTYLYYNKYFNNDKDSLVSIEFTSNTNAIDFAAINGHLNIIKFLDSHGAPCTYDAMNSAAARGFLNVVIWLDSIGASCTQYAIDYASKYNHFEIVKWLYEHRTEGFSELAINFAANNGNIKIFQYLYPKFSFILTERITRAMDWAAAGGQLEMLKWLHKNTHGEYTRHAMRWAVMNGHLEVIKWLHKNGIDYCDNNLLLLARQNGDKNITNWIISNRPKSRKYK